MTENGRNDKLGAAKPLYSIQHQGKTYYLDFETQRIKATLEAWAISRAFAALAKRKGMLSEDDYAMDRNQLNARIEAGDYSLDGGKVVRGPDGKNVIEANTIRKLLGTPEGMLHMVVVLLSRKHPDADRQLVIEMMQDETTAEQLQLVLTRIHLDSSPKSEGSEPAVVES